MLYRFTILILSTLLSFQALAQVQLVEEIMINGQSTPREFVVLNDTLYFVAFGSSVATGSHKIWKYDGENLSVALDLSATYPDFRPENLIVYNNEIYFRYAEGENEFDLWRFDGTTAVIVSDHQSLNGTYTQYEAVYNDKLYYTRYDPATGKELWSYDGTTASLAVDINPTNSSAPEDLFVFNDKLYFSANDHISGEELWSFDGDTAVLIADLVAGSGGSDPKSFIEYDGKMYFTAINPTLGIELHSYDGVNVQLAADIAPGSESSSPYRKFVYDGLLYMAASGTGSTYDNHLWTFDGTTASQVAHIADMHYPNYFTEYAGKLYMSGVTSLFGRELWSFNSSTNTGYNETDINQSGGYSNTQDLIVYKDKLYFAAQDDDHNMDFWSFNDIDVCERAQSIDLEESCERIRSDVANMGQSMPGCAGTANEDVWFSFKKNYQVSAIEVEGSILFDAVVELFEGTCGNLTSIGCFNETGTGETEVVNLSNLTTDETYYFRVYEFGDGIPTTLEFDVCYTTDVEINSITNATANTHVMAYPNPTNQSHISVAINPIQQVESVVLYNAIGQVVKQDNVDSIVLNNYKLPQANGIYFLRVNFKNGTASDTKVMKL